MLTLNQQQQKAVDSKEGYYLLIAGAGAGKTMTLVHRVASLLNNGIKPENILLLTFTKKAANEMMNRVEMLHPDGNKIQGGTFHAYAHTQLRKFSRFLGLESFDIADTGDSESIIRLLIKEEFPKDKLPPASKILRIFSQSLNQNISILDVIRKKFIDLTPHAEKIRILNEFYQEYLREHALLDFDALLLQFIKLLREVDAARFSIPKRCQYIMVDEYQDTNHMQAAIMELLSGHHHNLMAVGDDTQSIYAFRGAIFENILRFPEQFPGAQVLKLERNYRSTLPILQFTNALVKKHGGYQKILFTDKIGKKPIICFVPDEQSQVRFIVQQVVSYLKKREGTLRDVAVLARSRYVLNAFEPELIRKRWGYVKWGGRRLAEGKQTRDVLSFLQVVINRNSIAWLRLLNLCPGIGEKTAMKLFAWLGTVEDPFDSLQRVTNPAKAIESLQVIGRLLQKIQDKPIQVQLQEIIQGYVQSFFPEIERHQRSNLQELVALSKSYQDTRGFIEALQLSEEESEEEENTDLVLSTIHSAKGREFDMVFVPWCVENFFPSQKSLDDVDAVREELRMLYVAATRAKRFLYLVVPRRMRVKKKIIELEPSRFLSYFNREDFDVWNVK